MKKIKVICTILLILIVMITTMISTSYAETIKVTEENLNVALQNIASSDVYKDKYSFEIKNGVITITNDGESCELDYDLTNNPTFSISVPIRQGMSYTEFNKEIEKLSLPMIGYMGVTNVQGISLEDSSVYFATCFFDKIFSSMLAGGAGSSKYIISSSETTMQNSNYIVINESEFGNYVMDYVNDIYNTKETVSDKENIFTWSIEQKNVTNTTCELFSKLVINMDADFSKLKDYSKKFDLYPNITESNADYVVKLKVGQKCIIQTNYELLGYEISNPSCIEINKNNKTITAKEPGIVKGYISGTNMVNKKSIYISVEENASGKALEDIVLNFNPTSITNNPDNTTKNELASNTSVSNITNNQISNVVGNNITANGPSVENITTIPNAGYHQNKVIYVFYTAIILAILGIYIVYKYRNIK